jgi:hypothetical protein
MFPPYSIPVGTVSLVALLFVGIAATNAYNTAPAVGLPKQGWRAALNPLKWHWDWLCANDYVQQPDGSYVRQGFPAEDADAISAGLLLADGNVSKQRVGRLRVRPPGSPPVLLGPVGAGAGAGIGADERVETTLRVLPLMPAPDATDAVPRPVPRGRGRPRPRVGAVQWRIGPL